MLAAATAYHLGDISQSSLQRFDRAPQTPALIISVAASGKQAGGTANVTFAATSRQSLVFDRGQKRSTNTPSTHIGLDIEVVDVNQRHRGKSREPTEAHRNPNGSIVPHRQKNPRGRMFAESSNQVCKSEFGKWLLVAHRIGRIGVKHRKHGILVRRVGQVSNYDFSLGHS